MDSRASQLVGVTAIQFRQEAVVAHISGRHVNCISKMFGQLAQQKFVAIIGWHSNHHNILHAFEQPLSRQFDARVDTLLLRWKFQISP